MATLPTNRTTSDTAADHVTDHNTLHGLNNQLGNFTQAGSAPGSPASGDLWLDTATTAPSGTTALLAVQHYRAGSDAALATTTSSTYADVDATNAAITFTVPANGKVLIRVGALVFGSANAALCEYGWDLREGAADVANTKQKVFGGDNPSLEMAVHYVTYITGLTGGASKTYKLGHARVTGSMPSLGVYTGPNHGALTMEVWSAP